MSDPQPTRRKVTMTNVRAVPVSEAFPDGIARFVATDYILADGSDRDYLDAYVKDASTRWDSVEVSDEFETGPGGWHAATFIPAHLDHPLAGQFAAATTPEESK